MNNNANYYDRIPNYSNQNTQNWMNNTKSVPACYMGRFTSNPSDIMPQEVPMDGNLYFFPVASGTGEVRQIIGKRWSTNGLIETYSYVPETTDPMTGEAMTEDQSTLDDIFARLEALENQVSKLNKPKYSKSKSYKGGNRNVQSE